MTVVRLPWLAYGLMLTTAIALTLAVSAQLQNPPAAGQLDPTARGAPAPGVATAAQRIGAVGLVEPADQQINIGTNISAVVTQVFVAPGSRVSRGDPLFGLDARLSEAMLDQRRRGLAAAQARVAQAHARLPGLRAEVEAAKMAVEAAGSDHEDASDLVRIATSLRSGSSITAREATRRKNALRSAVAKLGEARARLDVAHANLKLYDETQGGASIALEIAVLEQERSAVHYAEADIALRSIRAPADGTVLQVNVRPGEFAQAGALSLPLIVMGRSGPLHVRVDIDESDIARLRPGSHATATIRGRAGAPVPLRFMRIEPLVVPKRALSGQAGERTDTRVLQALYEIATDRLPIWVGQQLDVLIE